MSLRRVVVLDSFLEENGDSLLGGLPPRRDATDGRFAAKVGELLRRARSAPFCGAISSRRTLKVWSRTSFCCFRVMAMGFS